MTTNEPRRIRHRQTRSCRRSMEPAGLEPATSGCQPDALPTELWPQEGRQSSVERDLATRRHTATSRHPRRRLGIRKRIARFVRALFGGSWSPGDWLDARRRRRRSRAAATAHAEPLRSRRARSSHRREQEPGRRRSRARRSRPRARPTGRRSTAPRAGRSPRVGREEVQDDVEIVGDDPRRLGRSADERGSSVAPSSGRPPPRRRSPSSDARCGRSR